MPRISIQYQFVKRVAPAERTYSVHRIDRHIENRYHVINTKWGNSDAVHMPVDRVLKRPPQETAQSVSPPTNQPIVESASPMDHSTAAISAVSQGDEQTIRRLTDKVIQSIDKRVIAQRERLGVR